jgi:hypothetical protein
MDAHAMEYVKVRNAAGTLQTNLTEVETALARREGDGWRLVSSVPETQNGDLVAILLLFARQG